MDKYNERPYYPYSWHQSHDQATILLMVPSTVEDDDLSVVIEQQHIIISVNGDVPIVKGKTWGPIDTESSVWQLEAHSARRTLGTRERTTSSASTASSTHSSYAFVSSDPDISSSFAASLDASDAEDSLSPVTSTPNLNLVGLDGLYPIHPRRKFALRSNPALSPRSGSPGHMTSSFSSVESGQAPQSDMRLLTVHLEKERSAIWPSLIVGPVDDDLDSSKTVLVFDAYEGQADKYNMDPTSLALIGLEHSDIRKEKEAAFEYFLRAWQQAHVPSATMRLVSHYLPLEIAQEPISITTKPTRGTTAYYLKSIGGLRGLAQLYLEAGLLHLEGAATTLLAASYSSLASIRIPLNAHPNDGSGGAEAWRRDREAAARFFDCARVLHPTLDIPALPAEAEMQLEMPSMHLHMPASGAPTESASVGAVATESELDQEQGQGPDMHPEAPAVRRRRKKEEATFLEKTRTSLNLDDLGEAWYVYIPGMIIGAGTALLVVGVVGALSFSTWSRRNQGS